MDIDRLAELRARLKALRAELRQLRERVLTGGVPLIGDRHVATIRRQVIVREIAVPRDDRAGGS